MLWCCWLSGPYQVCLYFLRITSVRWCSWCDCHIFFTTRRAVFQSISSLPFHNLTNSTNPFFLSELPIKSPSLMWTHLIGLDVMCKQLGFIGQVVGIPEEKGIYFWLLSCGAESTGWYGQALRADPQLYRGDPVKQVWLLLWDLHDTCQVK